MIRQSPVGGDSQLMKGMEVVACSFGVVCLGYGAVGFELRLSSGVCESYGVCGLCVVYVSTASALLGRGMWVFVVYESSRCTLFHM